MSFSDNTIPDAQGTGSEDAMRSRCQDPIKHHGARSPELSFKTSGFTRTIDNRDSPRLGISLMRNIKLPVLSIRDAVVA